MRLHQAALAAALLLGCERAPEPAERTEASAAPSASTPCVEHGVLEAVCTRCNPKLVPIFQAKGDWCAEHEFPESFCPICHPERGGRPAVELVADDGPAHGTLVTLDSEATAAAAGIETAVARAVETSAEITVLAKIAYDATRRAEVNARASGIVRELGAELGQHVERDAVLARIESPEVAADRARLLAARSRVETTRAALERVTKLAEQQLSSQRALSEARLELEAALAEEAAMRAALDLLGDGTGGLYELRAPLSGVVLRRESMLGQRIEAGGTLYEIVDPSSMWAELDVPENALARVRAGLEVIVSSDALAGRTFRGQIDHIAPEIDAHTRTAKARVRLANPDGVLRANLFVHARIVLASSGARVLVPRDAVQRAGEVQVVFVELETARYEARRVRTGAVLADGVELLDGVEPGERVVTVGSFLLKTETLKGSIGAGCCAVE